MKKSSVAKYIKICYDGSVGRQGLPAASLAIAYRNERRDNMTDYEMISVILQCMSFILVVITIVVTLVIELLKK